MIISISGRPGSGKSAVAARVASRLGMSHVSAGDFMRSMAEERGMTILELSRLAETDDSIDLEIDARTQRFGEEQNGFVIDARLAWYFLPQSVKVFLDVGAEEAARRIYRAERTEEVDNVDLEATARAIEARAASEAVRYRRYYGVDYLDAAHYDLVVDTSRKGIDEVVDDIVTHVARLPRSGEGRSASEGRASGTDRL